MPRFAPRKNMAELKLLSPYKSKGLSLQNHIVMAPMTRCRAIGNVPNELMMEYYAQRADIGLIVTEGVSPSPEGLGYARIPGIFNREQLEAWKKVSQAVHKKGAKIFMQLMHTGRVGHEANLPKGFYLIGPSSQKPSGKIYTDSKQMQDNSQPLALTTEGVDKVVNAFVEAGKNAIQAGFDGVELHSANGYLLEQFLNPIVNNRDDSFGRSIESRCRFVLDIVEKLDKAIGKERIGIRFSPYSTYNDMAAYPVDEVYQTYTYLAQKLQQMDIAYIHLSINPSMEERTLNGIREAFTNTLILCNGLTPESGEELLQKGKADLVAFGKSLLANPDFAKKVEKGLPLNTADNASFYTADAIGYTDYKGI